MIVIILFSIARLVTLDKLNIHIMDTCVLKTSINTSRKKTFNRSFIRLTSVVVQPQ